MAAERSGLNYEGALYEALARGNKDSYFFSEELDKALNPFEPRYVPVPPTIAELRRIPPLNGADFGRSCEFEFEVAGDVFVLPTILIDLPSWIPVPELPNVGVYMIQDTAAQYTGNSYGYTNGVGYFLFSKIQIYQDKILLDEFSGDSLFAARSARGTLNSAYLENTLAGVHDGSQESVSAAAAPRRLRLELPFLGSGRRGFPSIAMRAQSFKLRLTLRRLEELVESSDAEATTAPAPWDIDTLYVMTDTPTPFTPLRRTAIGAPTLQLETRHIYTDGESQLALQSTPLEQPFSRLFENVFTFAPLDYSPLDRQAVAAVTRRLEARHPAGRLFWYIRSRNDLRANRRWKFTNATAEAAGTDPEYYNTMSLIIAGRDREMAFAPLVWKLLTYHAKEDRWPGAGLGEMNWGLGALAGQRPPVDRQPDGTVNFSTADRPTMYTEMAAAPDDLVLGKPATEFTVVVDAWALYRIESNRGFLKYGN